MPKITRMDKVSAHQLYQDLEQHLAPFLEERGLTLDLGNYKYNDGMIRFVKAEFKIPEVAAARDATNLRFYLMLNGIIASSDTRETFESKTYVLQDYRPRATKLPWVAKSKVDGKTYVLSNDIARRHFSKAA